MMEILRNTSFLCGHFTMNDWRAFANLIQNEGWKPDVLDAEKIEDCKNYYYNEFVDFSYFDLKSNSNGRKSKLEGILRYKKKFDKDISLRLNDGRKVPAHIGDVYFYLAPFDIVIFSIAVYMKDVDYDDMSKSLLIMRDLCHYNKTNAGEFVNEVIRPIYEVYAKSQNKEIEPDKWNFNTLVDNGNKLKIFQINEIEGAENLSSAKFDRMVYDMGCLMPLSDVEDDGTDVYYNKVMDAGRIAVFSGWRALALFDSFTMVTSQLQDFRRFLWISDYFGLIYIYSLFCYSFLLQYDTNFRDRDCDIKQLEADILLFERRYSYKRFSYNFLPLEISQAMERSLELQTCIDNLHNMVTQASAVYEKESDDKMNKVLTLLTVITICSTIWDLFSLIDAAYSFENGGMGYRVGIYILILTMLTVYLVLIQGRRRRK